MKAKDAEDLIKKAFADLHTPSVWADLGCGAGTFTNALIQLLPAGSEVFAIDKELQDFAQINNEVKITFQKADFERTDLTLPLLDGILMANSLHYVKDKIPLLQKLKKHLRESGQLLIIEYDTERSNPWVPYPANFNTLKNIVLQAGFSSLEKMAEVHSVYNNGKMYSCIIK